MLAYNVKNIVSFLFINLLPQLSGFILLKVYTENLSQEEFGLYSALMAIPPLLVIFFSFQLQSAISRFFFELKPADRKRLLGSALIFIAIISALMLLVFLLVLNDGIAQTITDSLLFEDSILLFCVIVNSFLVAVIAVLNIMLVVKEKGASVLKRVAFSTVVLLTVQFLSVAYFDGKVLAILLAILFVNTINLFIVYWQTKDEWVFRLDFRLLIDALRYSSPLIFHQMGGYLFNFSSLLILSVKSTLLDVAMFAVIFKMASLLKICVNSVNTAWQPTAFRSLTKSYDKGIKYVEESFRDFTYLFVSLYLVLNLIICLVIDFLLRNTYSELVLFVPLALGAYLFRLLYCFNTTLLFFDKKTKLIPVVTIASGLINVLIVFSLSAEFGYVTAIIGLVASMAFMAVFYTLYNALLGGLSGVKEFVSVSTIVLIAGIAPLIVNREYIYPLSILFILLYGAWLVISGKMVKIVNFLQELKRGRA